MIKWKLWKVTFIVLQTNQFTITTQETTTFKTFVFNSLTSYESSGNDYFVLNSDSITITRSGVYHFYYEDVKRPIMRGNNTNGYLFAHNKTDQFRENKNSNFIRLDI